MCTFEQEVSMALHSGAGEVLTVNQFEYVWHAPISWGTILFALNRYLPFVDTFISLHRK